MSPEQVPSRHTDTENSGLFFSAWLDFRTRFLRCSVLTALVTFGHGKGSATLEEVRRNLETSLTERIAREELKREPCWTESLAVGSVSFLDEVQPQISSRRKTEIVQAADELWSLQEPPAQYGQENGPEKCSIGANEHDFFA